MVNFDFHAPTHVIFGKDTETMCIRDRMLGIKIPRITVPVAPGRNLAIIAEVAARNFRLKAQGYNAAKELDRRMEMMMSGRAEELDPDDVSGMHF